MLILTRKDAETLTIGDDITVTVLGVKGNQVRLGVVAPEDVAVHREEIYQRIQQEESKGNTTLSLRQPRQKKPEITVKPSRRVSNKAG